jgi:hypothetical protein
MELSTYHDQEELEMINYVSKKNEIKFSPGDCGLINILSRYLNNIYIIR